MSRQFRSLLQLMALNMVSAALSGCATGGQIQPNPVNGSSDFQLTPERTYSHRGWIGIEIQPAPGHEGVLVSGTIPRSPAKAAGIQAGDLLAQADGRPLHGPEDFVSTIRSRKPGTRLRLVGSRGDQPQSFELTVENSPDENGVLERILVNLPAPALEGLAAITDEAVPSWTSLHGHIVVLDFWAPWCGVCHLVSAELNRWRERFGAQVTVVGIAAGPIGQIAQYAPRFHMDYPVFADPDERVSKAYDAFAVPLVLVVDATGVVRAVTLGYSSQRMSKMEKLVEKLLVSP